MFQWASNQFDKLTEAVAPPPTDAAGRFGYAVSRGDENTAMGCIAEIDPVRTVVNQSKGWFPIHMACQYSMLRLVRLLMNQPGASIQQPDYAGLTPLHHACMSTQRSSGLEVVKILIKEYSADPCAKNSQGQTPYELASLDSIRQYLLPIQLQRETQYALDNGGVGLAPGIDLGGHRVNRSNMAPPPQFGGAGVAAPPPGGGVAAPMASTPGQSRYPQTPGMSGAAPTFGSPMATASTSVVPQQQQPIPAAQPIARAPASVPGRSLVTPGSRSHSAGSSSTSRHARNGGSSLAIYSKYKADGFHSSSSDVGLQQKYGHHGANTGSGVAPPPSSGNAPSSGNYTAPTGPNPFSGAGNFGGVSRYASYGPTVAPAPASVPIYSGMGIPATQTAPQYFNPGATSTPAAAPATPAPGGPTSPFMPPPPYSGSATESTAATPAASTQATVVSSPFVAPQSTNESTPAASSLFESPPKVAEPAETQPEANQELTPAASGEIVDSSSKDTTISDWVETTDPTSGQTYYFNTKTNETSWEKPDDSTAAAAAAAVASKESMSVPSAEAKPSNDDWSETVDPSSGKSYYYNSKTGETSWEKPVSMTAPESNSATTTGDNEASKGTDEWVEASDPSSGNIYYYNTVTGETSWERPSALDSEEKTLPPESSTTAEVTSESVTDATGDNNALAAEAPKEEILSEQSTVADPISQNTDKPLIQEETDSSPPPIEKVVKESTAAAKAEHETTQVFESLQESSATETAGENTEESNSNTLPDGWIEATDPSSGKNYYCNTNTQETSWERPVPVNNGAGKGDAATPVVEAEVSESDSAVAVEQDLPDGWEEVLDPSSGNMYYFNKETQETSWEKPKSTTCESIATNATVSPNQEDNDWVETLDPSSGKNYYYNAKTGETSWEEPAVFKAQENPPATMASETQAADINVTESKPMSAEETFAQAAVNTPTKFGETSETQPQTTPGHQRKMSAEEIFASPPGETQSNGTPGPSTQSERPDFISPAAATQGSVVSPGELSTPGAATTTAENLFGAAAIDSTPAKMQETKSAEDLFGANSVDSSPAKIPESTHENGNDDIASDPIEDDEGMTDIPLSPDPVSLVKPASTNMPSVPDTTAAAPSQEDDLFAAIGMPPPPFQSRR